jgi:hypothetical protein
MRERLKITASSVNLKGDFLDLCDLLKIPIFVFKLSLLNFAFEKASIGQCSSSYFPIFRRPAWEMSEAAASRWPLLVMKIGGVTNGG